MNHTYITTKREKIISEIRGIRKLHKVGSTELLAVGITPARQALTVKFYQMSIIKKIESTPESVLKKWMRLAKKKMCKQCSIGLKHGDLMCRDDLRVFILADMIRRSL